MRKRFVKTETVKVARQNRQWSQYQQDIFYDIAHGTGNTHVDALAGTGKTSTIVESFYHIPAKKSILMCAFNKSIQTELESRAPEGVEVKTLHSLGYAACRRAFPKLGAPDTHKLDGYIKAEIGEDSDSYELRNNLAKAISLCKGYLFDTTKQVDEVIDRHDLDTCDLSREDFAAKVLKIMEATKKDTHRVDFDDMIWLPNVLNLKMNKYDYVFVDEAQDLNTAQINLALSSVKENGRIITVADTNQAIYSFRGADSNAVQNIVDRLHSKRMPLSVTYRCAQSIVELAQTLVPEIEYAPNAEPGSVQQCTEDFMEANVKPGDFVLSRVNAPLIKWCLNFLKARIPANIQGRDIGKSLTALIKKSGAKDVDSFLSWLSEYEAMEADRMAKLRRDASVIHDKAECLRIMCEGTNSLSDVITNIDKMFRDGNDKDRVMLSTTHKAKGLERDRVFVLSNTYKPHLNQEEKNLTYVAYTRAKKSLYLVK